MKTTLKHVIDEALKPLKASLAEIDEALKPMKASLNIVLSDMLCPWQNIRSNSFLQSQILLHLSAKDLEAFYSIDAGTCMVFGQLPAENAVANVQRAIQKLFTSSK